MDKYYNGTKLLSLKDANGDTPEIYICTTNRTGGKTVYFNRFFVNRFLDKREKFMLLYRFDYELNDVAEKFFKEIGSLFFNSYTMRSERRANGKYFELFLCDKSTPDDKGVTCGYAVSINSADTIKRISHLFNDVERMLLDEFQSETNRYCADEVKKVISIHTSIARGQGEQVRYVPLFLIGNPVTILNPYYIELGISERLTEQTKFLRGTGFVLEQGYVDSASKAQNESAFNRAFSRNSYVAYSSECVYLNDSTTFIEKPQGFGKYIATLKYKGQEYGVREYQSLGIIYCDNRPDTTFPFKLALTTADHQINYVMLKANTNFLEVMRYFFERGCFRFKDLRCKEVILKALSY